MLDSERASERSGEREEVKRERESVCVCVYSGFERCDDDGTLRRDGSDAAKKSHYEELVSVPISP